ncbi:MAG: DUF1311 domain-containing protein [Acidobacteria bacterium]|nr:DUF1311 domain-containing protein [Acidobacteriota bacterium]
MIQSIFNAVIIVCLVSWMAQGALHPSSKQDNPCPNAETQSELNDCALQQFKKSDAELNVVYKRILKNLEPTEKKNLIATQRAWLAYRDAYGKSLLERGGSAAPMRMHFGLAALTQERIKHLIDDYEIEGNV